MEGHEIALQDQFYYVKSGNFYTLLSKIKDGHYTIVSVLEKDNEENAIIHMKEIVNRMYEGGC